MLSGLLLSGSVTVTLSCTVTRIARIRNCNSYIELYCYQDCSEPEAGSSLGSKRSKRKNVIPAEGEDESSCSEDSTDEEDWHSSEDEVLDGEGEPDRLVTVGEGEPDRLVTIGEGEPDRLVTVGEGDPDRLVTVGEGEPDRLVIVGEGEPDRLVTVGEGEPDRLVTVGEGEPDMLVTVGEGEPDRLTSDCWGGGA